MTERTFVYDRIETPIGGFLFIADANGAVRFTWFDDGDRNWRESFDRRHPGVDLKPSRNPFGHATALKGYFKGDIGALDRFRVIFEGTPFQLKVWKALRKIPGGTTTSYGALAQKIGEPRAVRAVGLANGSNPVGLIVPCHRVIGSNGTLTGYGGGLPRKKWLLEHEARHTAKLFRLEASA
jgi:methylated-DNA-[protein]-cysteine S-methyltransferase